MWSTITSRLTHDELPRGFELMTFVVLAFGAVSGAIVRSGYVIGDGVDLYGTFWFYWWIGDCIGDLRNPSFTDMMFHPLGKDIFAHTGNNFVDAIVAQPFRWVFGFPTYQPWFVWALLVTNALAFQPLARKVCGGRSGAWAATALWMLNPFVLFELMCGRLTQALLWFLPLAIWQFLEISREGDEASNRRRWISAVLAGLFTGLQGWTYWFGGYFLLLALGVLALAEVKRMFDAKKWRNEVFLGWTISAAVCLLVVAPAGIPMILASSVPGTGTDVESIFALPPGLANNVSATLHGYLLQETRGQPMLGNWLWGGGLVAIVVWGRAHRVWLGVAFAALSFAVGSAVPAGVVHGIYSFADRWIFLSSWGPAIGLELETMPSEGLVMPHYMLAYKYLPFFDRLWFPYRLVVITFLALALCLGGLVHRVSSTRPLGGWGLAFGLVLLGCIEQGRHLAYPLLNRDMTPPSVYDWLGDQEGGLVELPMEIGRVSIAWQVVHQQPTYGGMAENASLFWPEGYSERLRANRFVRALRNVTRNPEEFECCDSAAQQAGIDALRAEGFRWIVLDRHLVDSDLHRHPYGRDATEAVRMAAPFDVQDHLVTVLGEPVAVDGPLVVWDLLGTASAPEELMPTETNLSRRTWPMDDMPAYEAHLRSLGRLP